MALVTLGPGVRAQAAGSYAPFPKPDAGYVTDAAHLLSPEQQAQLEILLAASEKAHGVKIVVVTIGSIRDYPGSPNRDIEEYARALFYAYGLKPTKGVLLLAAHRDREARIDLGGRYSNRRDAAAARVMELEILPCFRQEQYAEGVNRGTQAMIREFADASRIRRSIGVPPWVYWALIGAVTVLIPSAISVFRNGKRSWGWVVIGLIVVVLLAVAWILRRIIEELPNPDERHSLGGHGRFGGRHGWFGGFGGGFSGGGGATGRW